jgi:hypothetical protein
MAKSAGGGGDEGAPAPEGLPQHPLVDRLKPDPSQPAKRVIVLTGLPGNSDRPGYQRLYLTTKLDYYAEFLTSDMVHAEAVAADRSPFPGHEATRVSIGRDSTIHYIWARSPQPVDEFDLDIRLGTVSAAPGILPFPTRTCPDNTFCGTCDGTCDTCRHTCQTCQTCPATCPATCQTCQTCPATCPATCQTCQTCQTCPGQGTCNVTCTCHRTCADTCTCDTCPHTCTCCPRGTCF